MAQPVNLVPNHSFENTIPLDDEWFWVKYWETELGTPDYFHSYYVGSLDSRGTPLNYYGYQIPKNDGKGYFGLGIKNLNEPEKREYIQIKLKQTLLEDSLYDFSMWVNLPDSFHWACGQKNIGFAFSDTLVKSDFEILDRLSPLYFSDSLWNPNNKTGWEKISTRIKAKGNESYLIIGNFRNSDSTVLLNIGGGNKNVYKDYSYYFIDKVELHLMDTTKEDTTIVDTTDSIHQEDKYKKLVIPNVFTPNGDGFHDEWMIANDSLVEEVTIFDRWGKEVVSWKGPGGSRDGHNSEAGVYFYKVVYWEEGKLQEENGRITLMR